MPNSSREENVAVPDETKKTEVNRYAVNVTDYN